MKNLAIVIFAFAIAINSSSQTLSPKITASGGGYATSVLASLSWTMGETNINTLQSGTTILTQGFQQPEVNLNTIIKPILFIQGYYRNVGTATPMDNFGSGGCLYATGISSYPAEVDTVTVRLMDPNTQSQVGASVKGMLHTDGSVWQSYSPGVTFPASVAGNSYYIAITHRNAIETWSANPVHITKAMNYDFTSSPDSAFGSNMVWVDNIGGNNIYALWVGDVYDAVNGIPYAQDGVVEEGDYLLEQNDFISTLFGYYTTDLTGDGVVEESDYLLEQNNFIITIFKATPW